MSQQLMVNQRLVELSTQEQQVLVGGQNQPMGFNNMSDVLGDGFPNTPMFNPLGSNGTGQKQETVNAHANNSGVILY
jgi:hypothetical protein